MSSIRHHLSVLLTLSLITTITALRPSRGCGTTPQLITSQSTTTPLSLTINNKPRTFYVRLPPSYNNTAPHRLIFTLHALGGTAEAVIAGTGGYLPYYGLLPFTTTDNSSNTNTIFVIPNGLNNGWANQASEDITFLQSVLTTVETELCMDQDLRFSTGFSYGGAMSYSLACSLGSELRGVAVLSGNPMISGCAAASTGNSDGAVAYYGQHGTSDRVLPVAGGREMRDRFVRLNGCDESQREEGEPVKGSGGKVETVYRGCREGRPVVWVAFDGDHLPLPRGQGVGEEESWTPGRVWEFFSQFS